MILSSLSKKNMSYKFPIAIPDLSGNEKKYVAEAMETGWISSLGPFVAQLEEAWAKFVGTKYAVACNSGTNALLLALAALKVGPGDEVILSDFGMIATAWAVTYLGATPVFVDCNGEDINIDVAKMEAAITKRTKVLLPTHIYGRPCDMEKIMKIAHDYNLYVVEDACEAHGATVNGARVGSIGDIGCFSLYSNKIITSGEGGLITTNDERLYKQLKHLRGMAFDPKHTFLHKKVAYNHRMTNLQAAVGLAQVERIEAILAKRKEILGWFNEKLQDKTLARKEGSVLWMYDLVLKNQEIRDEVMADCLEAGIEVRYFFKPMRSQPMYRGTPGTIANIAGQCGFYLPVYNSLTQEDVKTICEIVSSSIQKNTSLWEAKEKSEKPSSTS